MLRIESTVEHFTCFAVAELQTMKMALQAG